MIPLVRRVRAPDWWSAKIPPLLATAYATILVVHPTSKAAIVALGALLVSLVSIAAFGYVINDAFDVEDDRRRGKANQMASLTWPARSGMMAACVAVAFLPAFLVGAEPLAFALVGSNMLLSVLYSCPPVRLKEREFWGALADALAAHAVPTALAMALVGGASFILARTAFACAAVGWALCAGLRGIVVHQAANRATDRDAGVQTLGARLGRDGARTLAYRMLLPAEMLLLVVFVSLLRHDAPLVLFVTAMFVMIEGLRVRRRWILPMFDPPATSREAYVPFVSNEYHEVWLPLALAVQLAIFRIDFLPILVAHVFVFAGNTLARLRGIRTLLRPSGGQP